MWNTIKFIYTCTMRVLKGEGKKKKQQRGATERFQQERKVILEIIVAVV